MSTRDYISQSLETLIEMLQDRRINTGITPKNANELIGSNTSYFEFIIESEKSEQYISTKIKIIYYIPSKFKWADVKKSFEDEDLYDLYILVVRDALTQNNTKFIEALRPKPVVQIFELKRLQVNISKHSLVPKHELITDLKEEEEIIKQYCLKSKNQLPIILKSDAMAKYLNLKTGDIIRITRTSETSGQYVEYRCCL